MGRAPGVLALALTAACSFGGGGSAPDGGGGSDAGAPDGPRCAAPFVLSDHGCHAFAAATGLPRLAWDAARAACQGLGGDLPVIDTAAESAYVAAALGTTGNTRRAWLGLAGASPDGTQWTWLDGVTVAERALSLSIVGQPAPGTGCAIVRADNAGWVGRRCSDKAVVVCEKPL